MTNSPYLPVFVLLLAGVGFAVAPLALAWLWAWKFSPQKPGPSKNSIYECGLESERCLDPVQARLLPVRDHFSCL